MKRKFNPFTVKVHIWTRSSDEYKNILALLPIKIIFQISEKIKVLMVNILEQSAPTYT